MASTIKSVNIFQNHEPFLCDNEILFLLRRGYSDQEIEAMFAKYDMDGDRVLDSEEQRNVQMDIDGQKVWNFGHIL